MKINSKRASNLHEKGGKGILDHNFYKFDVIYFMPIGYSSGRE